MFFIYLLIYYVLNFYYGLGVVLGIGIKMIKMWGLFCVKVAVLVIRVVKRNIKK